MTLDMIATLPEAPAAGTIPAGRFVLRPVRKSDAGLFAMYAGDKRVAEATRSIPHPLPPGAAEAFVTRAMRAGGDEAVWVIAAAMQLYREEGWYLERVYKWMDRVGLESIRAQVTDPDARKQAGISMLLIDMDTPGVEIRPITLVDGHAEVYHIG